MESEKASFQKMIASYQQELEMDDSIRTEALNSSSASPSSSESARKASEHADEAAAAADAAVKAIDEAESDEDKKEKQKAAVKAAAAERAALRDLLATRDEQIEQLRSELKKSQDAVATLQKRVGKVEERETIAKNHAESARKRVEDLDA